MTIDQFHLSQLPADHLRNVWQPATDELHMNVLVLGPGDLIAEHVNQLLDVIVTCLAGSGTIAIDDESVAIEAGSIVLIPRGSRRTITAGTGGVSYTTVHRKRGGIMPTVPTK